MKTLKILTLLNFYLYSVCFATETLPEISKDTISAEPVAVELTPAPAALIPLASPTNISEEKSFSYGAQMRLRPELRNNTDNGGNRNYTLLRFRLSGTFKPVKGTSLFFQPQFSKIFGDDMYVGTSPNTNNAQQTSGSFYDTALIVHQAYLDYQIFDDLRFIGGRQALSYGDEVLVGAALGWANIGRSFDALKFIFTQQYLQSDLFWSRLVDTSTFTREGSGSADFGGFYNSFNLGPHFKSVDPYIFYLSDTRAASRTALWTAGLRMKSPVGDMDYRFEADFQAGKTRNGYQQNSQGLLELGYLVIPQYKLRIAAEGFTASPNFNQLFPAAHRWLGLADVLGRRNVTGGAFKTSIKPTSAWTISCEFFQFYRTSTDSPAYALAGVNPVGSPQKSSSSAIGRELDFNVSYQFSPTLNLSTGFNTLFPSEYIIQSFGKSNLNYAFFEIEARY